jgi:hypothetical protein
MAFLASAMASGFRGANVRNVEHGKIAGRGVLDKYRHTSLTIAAGARCRSRDIGRLVAQSSAKPPRK